MSPVTSSHHVSLFLSKMHHLPYFPTTCLATAAMGCLLPRNIMPHFEAQLASHSSTIAFIACLLPIGCNAVGGSPKLIAVAVHVAVFAVTRIFLNAMMQPISVGDIGDDGDASTKPTFALHAVECYHLSARDDKEEPSFEVFKEYSYHCISNSTAGYQEVYTFTSKTPAMLREHGKALEKSGFRQISHKEYLVRRAGLKYNPKNTLTHFIDVSQLDKDIVYLGKTHDKKMHDDTSSKSKTLYYIQILLDGGLFRSVSDSKSDIISKANLLAKDFKIVYKPNKYPISLTAIKKNA